jgi:hypothetical protein
MFAIVIENNALEGRFMEVFDIELHFNIRNKKLAPCV